MTTVAGYGWLMQHYGVEPVQPLPVRSEIGGGASGLDTGNSGDMSWCLDVFPESC